MIKRGDGKSRKESLKIVTLTWEIEVDAERVSEVMCSTSKGTGCCWGYPGKGQRIDQSRKQRESNWSTRAALDGVLLSR